MELRALLNASRKMSKIDKVLINMEWKNLPRETKVIFYQQGVSDHTPMVIKWHETEFKAIPFRFCNAWILYKDFKVLLEEVWDQIHYGNHVYILTAKLKELKKRLKGWSKQHFSRLRYQVTEAKEKLTELQDKM
ncbi:hypothetical protein FRX31_004515 [Thalictrum thalictroides]|uniref:Reverse transcriptase n=1 Tax=Thalictrum thalictroides TaxID=46969 RepID=A0A7J6X8Z2_THATH|nr:hypothetical protein FRX31_004515 [Thalictrum thalictroides]